LPPSPATESIPSAQPSTPRPEVAAIANRDSGPEPAPRRRSDVGRECRDQVVKDLKPIYTAVNADAAHEALEAFDQKWGAKLPVIGQAWRSNWEYVIPFLAYEPEVRRVIYTTNAIEALNRQLRKAVKTKGHFPTEDAARKLLYLAIQNAVPNGPEPAAGRKPSSRSKSNSEIAYPTNRLHS